MALIESTKDGRPLYRVRWNYRRDEHGKQRYDEARFRRRADAAALNREKTAGHTTGTETITVRELASKWFHDHVDTDACQLRTRRDYETQYRLRIQPWLDRTPVAKLTPLKIREWRDWMTSRRTGPRTVNKSLDALKSMVRWGRSEGLCTNTMIDDARHVKTPRPKPANPYTPAQVRQIADGCKHLRDATFVQVAAYSGLRWSEIRGVRWTDIDMSAATITLERSINANREPKSTKSDQHRIVPVLAPGMVALERWREHAPDVELVFPSKTNRPLHANHWYVDRLPAIREACGIAFDLHELRDTYASILIQSGIGEAELTLWLGHRSIQTTLNRYGKLFESRKTTLVKLANQSLRALS